jgi:hypothetical protein
VGRRSFIHYAMQAVHGIVMAPVLTSGIAVGGDFAIHQLPRYLSCHKTAVA